MQKQRIILIIGLVLGLIAVFMVNAYVVQQRQAEEQKAKEKIAQIQAEQTVVLVAKKEIPRGSIIEPDMLRTEIIPKQYVQPQAVTNLDRIAGMITIAPISTDEQVSLSKLTYPSKQRSGGLADVVPIGKRAITISVDNIAALVGMIKPGDYIDVSAVMIVPFTGADGKPINQPAVIPLFQNVLVLAVGQEIGGVITPQQESRYKKEEKREFSPLITLALFAQEASLIAFVQEQGKIRLTLRSPADSQKENVRPASWETLFQYIIPQETTAPAVTTSRKKEEALPVEKTTVEIYRGTEREAVPFSKTK
jgi:pilus assembly protein CpaB